MGKLNPLEAAIVGLIAQSNGAKKGDIEAARLEAAHAEALEIDEAGKCEHCFGWCGNLCERIGDGGAADFATDFSRPYGSFE